MTGGEAPMLDTTPITTEITKLIVAGVPEGELLARVVRSFSSLPDLSWAEVSAILQGATAAAERKVVRKH
jgi:hypothetical protein